MLYFSRTILIRAPIGRLYDFHLDTRNAAWISPPWQKILEVKLPLDVEVGAVVRLKVVAFGWPQNWTVQWEKLEVPHSQPAQARVVDLALQSPFNFWRHTHRFREVPGGVELLDAIEYELPWAPWSEVLGPLFHLHFMAMFAYRQKQTKTLLEAES